MLFSFLKTIKTRKYRRKIYRTPDYWDSKATEHIGSSVSMWKNRNLNYYYDIEQKNMFNSTISSIKSFKILDLGCGTGRFSSWLAENGAIVTGIDFSAKSVELAKQMSPGENPIYKVASVFDLNEPEPYDLIFSQGSLVMACQNSQELKQVFALIKNTLVPNGQVLFFEPFHRGFLSRVLKLDIREVCDCLTESGFQIENVNPLHFWPIRLLLCYINLPKCITKYFYFFGQKLLNLPFFSKFADYWSIYAKVRD
jgi:SAM-dependent methyltransferase